MGLVAYGVREWALKSVAAICLYGGLVGAAQAEVTVAALGDSLTQGYGLVQSEGFVPQLQAWLRDQGADVTVVNAGVSGDTTAGGLSRVDWTLTPDVDAMIVALGGNDLLRGIDPANSKANLNGILAAADEAGVPVLMIGMEAPGNYGADYKEAFDGMYGELAAEWDVALAEASFLGTLMEIEDRAAASARYMQSDGIHPNAEGVALIVEALGPEVLELVERAAE
ncbi:Esterase TesA precursor [Rhodobacteraceae bacterium THAF1]|nr:Esterase TesA precursor [Palleronia sp. THAF1]VDC22855.1 Esterase TesA precursor [Rhodobacteraceae bacterium THAF1]